MKDDDTDDDDDDDVDDDDEDLAFTDLKNRASSRVNRSTIEKFLAHVLQWFFFFKQLP